jgi:hypothetical protein
MGAVPGAVPEGELVAEPETDRDELAVADFEAETVAELVAAPVDAFALAEEGSDCVELIDAGASPASDGADEAVAAGDKVALAESEGVALAERDGVLLAESDALVVVDDASEGVALAECDALGVVEDDSEGVALAESEEVGVVDAESVGVVLAETEALALVVALTALEEDMMAATSTEESVRA